MSVYLLESQPLSLTFLKVSIRDDEDYDQWDEEKYKGSEDLILQDRQLTATGDKGVLSGKIFHWNVFASAGTEVVPESLGFNLHFSLLVIPRSYEDGDPHMRIRLRGDFVSLFNHVFNEVPPTPAVNFNVAFDFQETACYKTTSSLLATGLINEYTGMGRGQGTCLQASHELILKTAFYQKIFKTIGKPTIARVTVELFGKDWTPSWVEPVILPEIRGCDEKRTQKVVRKILEEKALSDFVLVAQNGFEMPCHKAFLQVSSPFFERMFQTDCQETKEEKCKLGLSEEGLKALLEFLYCSDIATPKVNSGIAVELLEISHELQISELETKMKELLVRNADEWLEFDGALQLFIRCTKLDLSGYDKLKEKAVNVIKKKRNDLKSSSVFDELLDSNPKFAKEFLSFFI